MTAAASTVVIDALRVGIEMRPPKSGEAGWCVNLDASPIEALADVLKNRDTSDVGTFGFGWIARGDHSDDDATCVPDGERLSRYVTITVVELRDTLKLDDAMLDRAVVAWFPALGKHGGVCREAMRDVLSAALSMPRVTTLPAQRCTEVSAYGEGRCTQDDRTEHDHVFENPKGDE